MCKENHTIYPLSCFTLSPGPAGPPCDITMIQTATSASQTVPLGALAPLLSLPIFPLLGGVGLHPTDLQGPYLLSFKFEERAQGQQQRHWWFNG